MIPESFPVIVTSWREPTDGDAYAQLCVNLGMRKNDAKFLTILRVPRALWETVGGTLKTDDVCVVEVKESPEDRGFSIVSSIRRLERHDEREAPPDVH